MCDVSAATMAETKRLCEAERPAARAARHHAMSPTSPTRRSVMRFRDEVAEQHDTDRMHLLFNNAGIGGGGSMVVDERDGVGAHLQRLLGRRLSTARAPSCRCC